MTRSMAALVVLVGVAGAVAFGYAHPFGDPRREQPTGRSALLAHADIAAEARAVLVSKCADCHSSETRWPVYARLAPGSWLIERDVMEGRKHMDLSHWPAIPSEQQEVLKAEIVQQARSGHMPPLQYRLLHREAKLSARDVQALGVLRQSAEPLSAAGPQAGDPVHGKQVFEKRCTGCHAMRDNREGPRLQGVFGRKAGSVPAFHYSEALSKAGVIWGEGTLERWLADPDSFVPDNAMGVGLPKALERRDLIAFLKGQRP